MYVPLTENWWFALWVPFTVRCTGETSETFGDRSGSAGLTSLFDPAGLADRFHPWFVVLFLPQKDSGRTVLEKSIGV
jgi:hypothetical protein